MAEASRRKMTTEAEGCAAATRAQGEADADIILRKGEAEAKAMNVKAEAYQEWNQAAVMDKFIASLPELIRAMAAPLRTWTRSRLFPLARMVHRHAPDYRRHDKNGGADPGTCSKHFRACACPICLGKVRLGDLR